MSSHVSFLRLDVECWSKHSLFSLLCTLVSCSFSLGQFKEIGAGANVIHMFHVLEVPPCSSFD